MHVTIIWQLEQIGHSKYCLEDRVLNPRSWVRLIPTFNRSLVCVEHAVGRLFGQSDHRQNRQKQQQVFHLRSFRRRLRRLRGWRRQKCLSTSDQDFKIVDLAQFYLAKIFQGNDGHRLMSSSFCAWNFRLQIFIYRSGDESRLTSGIKTGLEWPGRQSTGCVCESETKLTSNLNSSKI